MVALALVQPSLEFAICNEQIRRKPQTVDARKDNPNHTYHHKFGPSFTFQLIPQLQVPCRFFMLIKCSYFELSHNEEHEQTCTNKLL
jgi:hypothetical protein